MTDRQLYPAAPLRFVAFEVQYGFAPTLATEQGRADVYGHLQDVYPIADAQMTVGFEFIVGPAGGAAQPQSPQAAELVLVDRERTRSVTVGATGLSVQSVLYKGAEELERAITVALNAVAHAGISAVKRVGLRFVDEIRAVGIERATDWSRYVSDELVSPLRFAREYGVEQAQGVLAMRASDDIHVVMRFGPGTGFAVNPEGRLRLPPPAHPQFFLLDIDTFWADSADELRPFAVDGVLALYRQLDEPAHVLFERAITDTARDLFQNLQRA